jgi:hypothetical protein
MKKLSLLLAPVLLLSSCVFASAQTGSVTLFLDHFYAHASNGTYRPQDNDKCAFRFGLYRGPTTTDYVVGNRQSAVTTYQGKIYHLHPLGLAHQYAFGVWQRPAEIYGVLFSMTRQFTNPVSSVLLSWPEQQLTCRLTNSAVPN